MQQVPGSGVSLSVSPACTGSNRAGTFIRSGTVCAFAGSMNTAATGEAAFSI